MTLVKEISRLERVNLFMSLAVKSLDYFGVISLTKAIFR